MDKLFAVLHTKDKRAKYGFVVASVAVAALVRLALTPLLGWHSPYITFFLAVVFSAWIAGLSGGVCATAMSAAIALAIQGHGRSPASASGVNDAVACGLFVLEGLAIAALGEAQHLSREHALVQTERAEASMQSAERSLAIIQESELRNATVLEVALDCIITIDSRGCITEFNPAAEATFGYKKAEVLGRSVAGVVIPPALHDAHLTGFANFLETGKGPVLGKRIEITAMRRDGEEFPVELAIIPAKIGGDVEFTAYLRDISDRKHAEYELRQAVLRQRLFLRDVLFSVTQGHLRLCDSNQELPARCPSSVGMIELNPATGKKTARGLTGDKDSIVVGVWMLLPGEEMIVARRLHEVLSKASESRKA